MNKVLLIIPAYNEEEAIRKEAIKSSNERIIIQNKRGNR